MHPWLERIDPTVPRARSHVMSVFGVFMTVLLWGSAEVHATDAPNVKSYSVRGETGKAVRQSLDRAGPKDRSGVRRDGLTSWALRWRHSMVPEVGACRIADFEPQLQVEIVLPEWSDRGRADEELVERWDRYANALRAHEDGHVQIARAATADLAKQVAALPPAKDCDTAKAAVDRLGQAVLKAARQGESQYDVDTRHGATQGALFP